MILHDDVEAKDAIRDVLLSHWDPAGVGENPLLRDEYDSYLPELIEELRQAQGDQDRLYRYLYNLEMENIAPPDSPERIRLTAEALGGFEFAF